jgi:hypothetical protein
MLTGYMGEWVASPGFLYYAAALAASRSITG